jgi:hypothetical protein
MEELSKGFLLHYANMHRSCLSLVNLFLCFMPFYGTENTYRSVFLRKNRDDIWSLQLLTMGLMI